MFYTQSWVEKTESLVIQWDYINSVQPIQFRVNTVVITNELSSSNVFGMAEKWYQSISAKDIATNLTKIAFGGQNGAKWD